MGRLLLELCARGRAAQAEAVMRRMAGGGGATLPREALLGPLVAACAGGHAETARAVLARGGAALAGGRLGEAVGGQTPLLAAAEAGHAAVVAVLLDAGADPGADNGHGWAPLHGAHTAEVVAALAAAGAPLEAANSQGHVPLETALRQGRAGAAAELLARGARITPRALALAARAGGRAGEAVRQEARRRRRERVLAFAVAADPLLSRMPLFDRRLVRVVADFVP